MKVEKTEFGIRQFFGIFIFRMFQISHFSSFLEFGIRQFFGILIFRVFQISHFS